MRTENWQVSLSIIRLATERLQILSNMLLMNDRRQCWDSL